MFPENYFYNLLFNVPAALSHFVIFMTTIVVLHCFFNPCYTLTKKKFILFFILTLGYYITPSIHPVLNFMDHQVFLVTQFFILTYDYPGKKVPAFLVFFTVNVLLTSITSSAGDFFSYSTSNTTIFDRSIVNSNDISIDEFISIMKSINNFQTTISNSSSILFYILSIFIYGALFSFIYFRLYKRNITMQCPTLVIFTLAITSTFMFEMTLTMDLFGKYSVIYTGILSIMSILLVFAIPISLFITKISHHYKEQTTRQNDYMQAQLSHFTQYKQTQEETARFRHDIRNNLLCINEMLQSGKAEEASIYLQDLLKTSDALRQTYVSGDEMLDCIIGVKDSTMKENQIVFQLDGVLAGGLHWKPADICAVFANALDNAIDACLKVPEAERYIRMNIKSTNQYWFITIVNPVAEKVDTKQLFQSKGGYTTKSDTTRHGIGTYNMKHTVENYGGLLKAEATDQEFTLEVMIDRNVAQ